MLSSPHFSFDAVVLRQGFLWPSISLNFSSPCVLTHFGLQAYITLLMLFTFESLQAMCNVLTFFLATFTFFFFNFCLGILIIVHVLIFLKFCWDPYIYKFTNSTHTNTHYVSLLSFIFFRNLLLHIYYIEAMFIFFSPNFPLFLSLGNHLVYICYGHNWKFSF